MAAAIAARYGLPAAELAQRMAVGRFRVKTGVDLETAERLIYDLESLGALCSLEDEAGHPVSRSSSQSEMQSGLAAATSGRDSSQDLGVLAQESQGLALATLDGQDDRRAEGVQTARQYDESAFAPPEMAVNDDLQLAAVPSLRPATGDEELAAPLPPLPFDPPGQPQPDQPYFADEAIAHGTPHQRAHTSSLAGGASLAASGPFARVREFADNVMAALASAPRARFATGVFLAVLIGFLPAHVITSLREGSAFSRIDDQVHTEQDRVETLEQWQALDGSRELHLARKKSARRNIVLGGIAIWIVAGAGLGFLWFRRLDWDRFRNLG